MSLFLDTSCDQRRTQKHDVFKRANLNTVSDRGLHKQTMQNCDIFKLHVYNRKTDSCKKKEAKSAKSKQHIFAQWIAATCVREIHVTLVLVLQHSTENHS